MRLAGGGGDGCRGRVKLNSSVSKMINSVDNRSTSASLDDNDDYYDDDEYDTSGGGEAREKAIIKDLIEAKKKRYQEEAGTPRAVGGGGGGETARNSRAASRSEASKDPSGDIDDIWKNNTSEYKPASPHYVLSQFGKKVAKAVLDRFVDPDDPDQAANGAGGPTTTTATGSQKVSSKFAVSPPKLPKPNMARLEATLERGGRASPRRSAVVSPKKRFAGGEGEVVRTRQVELKMGNENDGSSSTDDTSSSGLDDEEQEDEEEDEESDPDSDYSGGVVTVRLAGGAEKRPNPGDSTVSVSDTETLVGDEGGSHVTCKRRVWEFQKRVTFYGFT